MSRLIRLVYASRATFESVGGDLGVEAHVARILMQSRHNNPRRRIGGVLYYGDGCFFQCLEGDVDAVKKLMQTLNADSRHEDVKVLSLKKISTRRFHNWSMKYIPVEDEVQALLQRFGFDSFVPHEFSEELIAAFMDLFERLADPEIHPDQQYPKHVEGRGFFGRLWRRLGF